MYFPSSSIWILSSWPDSTGDALATQHTPQSAAWGWGWQLAPLRFFLSFFSFFFLFAFIAFSFSISLQMHVYLLKIRTYTDWIWHPSIYLPTYTDSTYGCRWHARTHACTTPHDCRQPHTVPCSAGKTRRVAAALPSAAERAPTDGVGGFSPAVGIRIQKQPTGGETVPSRSMLLLLHSVGPCHAAAATGRRAHFSCATGDDAVTIRMRLATARDD